MMKIEKIIIYFLFIFCSCHTSVSSRLEDPKDIDSKDKPPKIGNFSLPSSQQLSPMISFGEGIIDQGLLQVLGLVSDLRGNKNERIVTAASWLYGIRDDLSILVSAPYFIQNRVHANHAKGWGDLAVQLEYVLYANTTHEYEQQITVLGNVTIPTGSTHKTPANGLGSNSYFIGATYARMTVDWLYFLATGGIFTTPYHHYKEGNKYRYDFGIGRTIATPPGWIFAWVLEFNGIYRWKDKTSGVTDLNTGGNSILLIPSLWVSTEKMIFQIGAGPVFETLNGQQSKKHFFGNCQLTWTF